MSAEAYRNEETDRSDEPDVINIKRNPYLVDYEQQRRARERRKRVYERQDDRNRRTSLQEERIPERQSRRRGLQSNSNALPQRRRAALERKRVAARRKRIVKIQRLTLCTGVFCIALLCGILVMKRMDAKATETDNTQQQTITGDISPAVSSDMVQGLSAETYAQHPDWEENFLTPNEYSRPGDALEEVNSIFVHYTANPNTSAAQNRSYFEQLKDTHITSASAHFIIGYDGEIIQCIPLDEIAYAVQTRNFDSVSIECCYKAANGQFTQETYDSLIELLAWLTNTYDLTTDDILRHYDCGGKKCPIYYTEHEDAWEQLKRDVAKKL